MISACRGLSAALRAPYSTRFFDLVAFGGTKRDAFTFVFSYEALTVSLQTIWRSEEKIALFAVKRRKRFIALRVRV